MGGSNPIRIQSMTNTSTQDTDACVAQAKRIVDAGGEYVRLTTQGVKEAENLMNINAALRQDGYMVPLVADVHFNPKVADVAAQYAEKGRNAAMDLAERGRTQAKIVSEQTKLARAQRQLGALVYSLAKGNEENQPLVDKYIEMIGSIEANLNALKESLGPAAEVITHDLDEEPAEGSGITVEPTVEKDKKPDTDKKTCPQCGAPVSEDALFCNKCGAQL